MTTNSTAEIKCNNIIVKNGEIETINHNTNPIHRSGM